ncbi:MAG TPA: FlgO family outer membrane protein [Leptospiraceae bacterium]|nr:FlgO family outer membrane protein [Leptospiraceae bacterium]HMW03877.1 FlgO family outer membrane protein [Leptospiraceae bacterium]HMY29857.1 FlgO family outer membrane protein [Leptospiraceae bacterium]HMZ62999.1 FlgO family outer membrane protein [Leptospiraceae bacterium]HNA07852.1 FlgO family outer membrane protein [Leptospiraceae bacterium]
MNRKNLSLYIIPLLFFSLQSSCSYFSNNTKNPQPNQTETNSQTPMEKIAETFSKKMPQPNSRLIVLTFTTTEGKEHKLGNLFAEKLTTDLARRGNMVVLDRILFSKQLLDNKLSLSSANDLAEIRRIGELLGLNAIVTGMVTSFNNGYGLNCRVVDPKTGFILAAEEAFYAGE